MELRGRGNVRKDKRKGKCGCGGWVAQNLQAPYKAPMLQFSFTQKRLSFVLENSLSRAQIGESFLFRRQFQVTCD
jgi:hypothetical protein